MGWVLAAFLVSGLAASVASAFSGGIAAGATGCTGCHGSGTTSSVVISLSGPAELAQGETGTYTASINTLNSGSGLSIQMTGDAAFGLLDANTKLLSDQLTHTMANVGDWSYDFQVVVSALATVGDTIELALAMMAFDGPNGNGDSDIWNAAISSIGISVIPEPATALLMASGLLGMALAGRRHPRRR